MISINNTIRDVPVEKQAKFKLLQCANAKYEFQNLIYGNRTNLHIHLLIANGFLRRKDQSQNSRYY